MSSERPEIRQQFVPAFTPVGRLFLPKPYKLIQDVYPEIKRKVWTELSELSLDSVEERLKVIHKQAKVNPIDRVPLHREFDGKAIIAGYSLVYAQPLSKLQELALLLHREIPSVDEANLLITHNKLPPKSDVNPVDIARYLAGLRLTKISPPSIGAELGIALPPPSDYFGDAGKHLKLTLQSE